MAWCIIHLATKHTLRTYSFLFLCCVLFTCKKDNKTTAEEEETPQTIMPPPTTVVTDTTNDGITDTTSMTMTSTSTGGDAFPVDEPVILAYFPSWSENFVSVGQPSKLRDIPAFVNHVFLAFAKPNLSYLKGSYDLFGTGIEAPYDGCTLKESIGALKAKGINVILSVGGETYWRDASSYEIDYAQIKDLVDDIGLAGIDWDFEPDGSFQQIGNELNVNRFITFFNESRSIMPKEEGYLLACRCLRRAI
jgi:hypothetical protein